jgi:hypothetical protein
MASYPAPNVRASTGPVSALFCQSCIEKTETHISHIYIAGFWTVPCFSVKQIELSFNEHRFAINPRDFYLGRVSARSTDCVAGILAMGNGLPANLAIIGDEFLKSCKCQIDFWRHVCPI